MSLLELKDTHVESIDFDSTTKSEVHLTIRFDHGPDAHYDRVTKSDSAIKNVDIVQYICGHLSNLSTLTRNDFVDHISQYFDERLGLIQ